MVEGTLISASMYGIGTCRRIACPYAEWVKGGTYLWDRDSIAVHWTEYPHQKYAPVGCESPDGNCSFSQQENWWEKETS